MDSCEQIQDTYLYSGSVTVQSAQAEPVNGVWTFETASFHAQDTKDIIMALHLKNEEE